MGVKKYVKLFSNAYGSSSTHATIVFKHLILNLIISEIQNGINHLRDFILKKNIIFFDTLYKFQNVIINFIIFRTMTL